MELPEEERQELDKIGEDLKGQILRLKESCMCLPINELGSYELETNYDLVYDLYQDFVKTYRRLNGLENYRQTINYRKAASVFEDKIKKLSKKLEEMADESVKRILAGDAIL